MNFGLMIQSPENYVLCEIEKKFQNEDGGIFIDTTWHPEEYATLEGTVKSIPKRVFTDGYRNLTGTVGVGDKVFFSYSIIYAYASQPNGDTPVYKNLMLYEGKEYWKVPIDEFFCKITDKGVEMITDNILIEPVEMGNLSEGKVVGMPNVDVSCKIGDLIYFEPKYVQQYNIFGANHYIIAARRAIAKAS